MTTNHTFIALVAWLAPYAYDNSFIGYIAFLAMLAALHGMSLYRDRLCAKAEKLRRELK